MFCLASGPSEGFLFIFAFFLKQILSGFVFWKRTLCNYVVCLFCFVQGVYVSMFCFLVVTCQKTMLKQKTRMPMPIILGSFSYMLLILNS